MQSRLRLAGLLALALAVANVTAARATPTGPLAATQRRLDCVLDGSGRQPVRRRKRRVRRSARTCTDPNRRQRIRSALEGQELEHLSSVLARRNFFGPPIARGWHMCVEAKSSSADLTARGLAAGRGTLPFRISAGGTQLRSRRPRAISLRAGRVPLPLAAWSSSGLTAHSVATWIWAAPIRSTRWLPRRPDGRFPQFARSVRTLSVQPSAA